MTLTANDWAFGRMCLWLSLVASAYFLYARFGPKSLVLLFSVVLFRGFEEIFPWVGMLYDINLFIIFALTGLACFGESPYKMRRILIVYLLISLPFLILQIIGFSPILMYWNTDYAHDLSVLSLTEVGSFKDIAQYPTFLVTTEELFYQIGQGRPSGLTPSNNLLSVLIVFTLIFNLHIRNKGALNIGDVVTNLVAVLIMSKLVFVILFFVYLFGLVSKHRYIKMASFKNTLLFITFLYSYSIIFPGLFSVNFGDGAITASIGVRSIDVLLALGLDDLITLFWFADPEYALQNTKGEGVTSGLALVLNSIFWIPLTLAGGVIFWKLRSSISRNRRGSLTQVPFYNTLLVAILVSFVAVPVLFKSILFAFIMGLILQTFTKAGNSKIVRVS